MSRLLWLEAAHRTDPLLELAVIGLETALLQRCLFAGKLEYPSRPRPVRIRFDQLVSLQTIREAKFQTRLVVDGWRQ